MTEMSTAGDPSAAPGGAAPGGKADPVVPDTVVYVCSLIIVVMVVGGVIALSMLMKQRLEVNQNVTTGGPAPAVHKRLVSVEDSEANEFKILNDDDPFHYRVAKAREGYRRKVPFYEAAHSKQKANKHKKTTTRTQMRKKPLKKATRLPPKAKKTPPKQKKTSPKPMKTPHKTPARRAARTHPTARPKHAKTVPKQVKGKGHLAQHRELRAGTTSAAAAIKEIGIASNISDVGADVMEIKANKPKIAAAANKGGKTGSNDDTAKGKSFVEVAAKKLSAKEKKQKAIAETMKILLGKASNILDAPEKINLSDVSDFIASDNHSVSELASEGDEATNESTKHKLPDSAVLLEYDGGAGREPKAFLQNKHFNRSTPVGHSDNAAPSGVPQGNASQGNHASIASDLTINSSLRNATEGAASALNQSHAEVNKSPDKLSPADEHPAGSFISKNASSEVSSKQAPKGDLPSGTGESASASVDKGSPPNAVPLGELDDRHSPDALSPVKGPTQAGEPTAKKSPDDQPVNKASNSLAAGGASASAPNAAHPSDMSVDPSASKKLPNGVLSPAGEILPGASAAKTSSANEKAPDTNTAAAGGALAGAPSDNSTLNRAVPADGSALQKDSYKQPTTNNITTGKSDSGKSLKVEAGDKAPAANVPPASGASASASVDNAPPANVGPHNLPDGRSPVHEVPEGIPAEGNPRVGESGGNEPSANRPPANGGPAGAFADSAPAAKGLPLDANKVPGGRSPVGEMPAGRSAADESPVGESGDKAPAANLPPATSQSVGAPADSLPAAGDLPAGANMLSEDGTAVDGVPADRSAARKFGANEVDGKAPAAHPVPDGGASAGASASGASLSNLGQSPEKESARTNEGANGAPAPVAPGSPGEVASDSKAKGDSAVASVTNTQRPLFCEVRKITRPLASYCTHLLFGRLPLVTINGAVTVGDFDSNTQEQLRLMAKVRPSWPQVGLLTTLGGGGELDDAALARVFEAGDTAMDALAMDVAHLVRSRGLDGLNVHWAVPDLEGDVDSQARGLVTFLKKLRTELGSSALITVVLPSEREERNAAFNVKAIQPLANYLFLSTHKNFNPYSALTRFNAPAQDTETGGMFTAIADVIRDLGSSNSRQLCFTFGLSGVSYKVDENSALAKYVPLVGAGGNQASAMSAQDVARLAAQLPKEGRAVTYDEVCKLNLTCHRAYVEKSCYDKVGDTWFGYLDEEAVASKAKWLLKDGWENLCVVAWNVDSDDIKGTCRSNGAAPYPLLRTLSHATAELSY